MPKRQHLYSALTCRADWNRVDSCYDGDSCYGDRCGLGYGLRRVDDCALDDRDFHFDDRDFHFDGASCGGDYDLDLDLDLAMGIDLAQPVLDRHCLGVG